MLRTFALLSLALSLSNASAQSIDLGRSSVSVHVDKSGFFSAFAHNHVIRAPIASGELNKDSRSILLTFNTKDMKVIDEGVKDSERAEIEQTMKSDKVLAVDRFPEIRFVSTSVTAQGDAHDRVQGDLTLHGVTKPVEMTVALEHDRYYGSVKLKQTDFGIAPVSIAGGTVKVKDVIEIVFEIVPAEH